MNCKWLLDTFRNMNEMNVNQIELCSNKNDKILCNKDERQKPIISGIH